MEKMGQWIHQMSLGMERKVAELTREHGQFKMILDTMQEGVLVLDAEGNIQLLNPAARDLLGIEDDALGRSPIEVVRNPNLQEMVDETLAGQGSQKKEIRLLRDGQEIFLLVQATSLPGEGRSGAILAFFDITPMRKLERVRRDFVANVSHEIKTPLTSIQGYVETLLDPAMQDPEAAKNFLNVIDANSKRLSKLVEDLLRLSEIESQQFVLHAEEIEIVELFEEVAALHEVKLKKKENQVQFSVGLKSLSSDRNALLHILGNLLENAIKYGRPGCVIRLECRPKGRAALFSVTDQGIGIEKAHLDRIFERFYRVDTSRSRGEGGTGLGLAIVKHLVQVLGGEVWVESEYGEGTTFYFTIPL
jgi:two-component system phosphate regulon sensor histidine kinase PhoR